MNLYKKYKAKNLDEIFGHETVVANLTKRFKQNAIPNVIFLGGTSGKGKTVLAEIIAKTIVCTDLTSDSLACNECANCKAMNDGQYNRAVKLYNGSDIKIDEARDLQQDCMYSNTFSPQSGPRPKAKVYILNEFQEINSAAMGNMLMLLEKEIPNVYFILTSMDEASLPKKLKEAILSRNAYFFLKDIKPESLLKLISAVYKAETNLEITESIQKLLMAIVYNANGSARNAFQMLESLIFSNIQTEEELLSELNIVSENKINTAISALISGSAKNFYACITEMNEEVFYKIRYNLTLLFQYSLGAQLGYKEKYIAMFKDKIESGHISKLLELINSIKPYPTQTDFNYIITQCLYYMRTEKLKERNSK